MTVKNPVAFLCAALLLAPAALFAASAVRNYDLSGTVLGIPDSLPVAGVEVSVAEAEFETASDADGRFRLVGAQFTAVGESAGGLSGISFSSATRELRLSLDRRGPVELTLFDVRGKATRLHSETHDAGEYLFPLDELLDNPLPAGLFLLRVEANGLVETFRLAGTGDLSLSAFRAGAVRRAARGSTVIDTLYCLIDSLGQTDRELVYLYLDGVPQHRIAAAMGIPRSTVASRMAAIKKKLKKTYENEDY